MKINTYASYKHAAQSDFAGNVVVVVDVLRATSTIVTAINNGCNRIYPVIDVEEAMSVYSQIHKDENILLGGENGCLKIPGFNLSNSPLDYSRENVEGKDIIITTTNGTRAINWAAGPAHAVVIGSLINASAAMKKALSYKKDITLLCAGTGGRYSLDDIIACGCMLSSIEDVERYNLCDLSYSCINEYQLCKNNIEGALKKSYHYKKLKRLGFKEDLEYCCQVDTIDAAPTFKDNIILKDQANN